jgi:hypothetical protein
MKHLNAVVDVLSTELPNLDCFVAPEEPLEVSIEVTEIIKGLELYRSYANLKSAAMKLRLEGKMPQACAIEDRCDAIHSALPSWGRW